jgi:hypothetical protein
MKVVVYLLMLLLLGPIERLLGSIVGAVFLAGMLGLGLWLLLRRTDRRGNDPQQPESSGYQQCPHTVEAHRPSAWTL